METVQVAETIVAPLGAVQNRRIVEIIEKRLITDLAGDVTEGTMSALADYLETDLALELMPDRTPADPFACILEGKHPETKKSKLWCFSIKLREELRS